MEHKIVKRKLQFKNPANTYKKQKNTTIKETKIEQQEQPQEIKLQIVKEEPIEESKNILEAFQGQGQIMSTGQQVIGKDTQFKSQLQSGDLIIIDGQTIAEEIRQDILLFNLKVEDKIIRKVILVPNDTSCFIQQSFPIGIPKFIDFQIQKSPENLKKKPDQEEISLKDHQNLKMFTRENKEKTDVCNQEGDVVSYRLKNKGAYSFQGYKETSQKIDQKFSRTDLLNLRTKNVSDKYC